MDEFAIFVNRHKAASLFRQPALPAQPCWLYTTLDLFMYAPFALLYSPMSTEQIKRIITHPKLELSMWSGGIRFVLIILRLCNNLPMTLIGLARWWRGVLSLS